MLYSVNTDTGTVFDATSDGHLLMLFFYDGFFRHVGTLY